MEAPSLGSSPTNPSPLDAADDDVPNKVTAAAQDAVESGASSNAALDKVTFHLEKATQGKGEVRIGGVFYRIVQNVATSAEPREGDDDLDGLVRISGAEVPAQAFQISYTPYGLQIARHALLHDKRFRVPDHKDSDLKNIETWGISDFLCVDEDALSTIFSGAKTIEDCLRQLTVLSTYQSYVLPQIANELVQTILREDASAYGHTQNTMHLEKTVQELGEIKLGETYYRRVKQTTPGSTAINEYAHYDKVMREHNANLAVTFDPSGNALCTRSARTDTPGRMLELVLTSLLAVLDSDSKMGLNDQNHFTCVITTGLDRNFLKAVGTQLLGVVRPFQQVQNERTFIYNIEQAIETLWTDGEPLKVTVKGTEYFINKPLLKARILSGATQLPAYFSGIDETREKNSEATKREIAMLKAQLEKETGTFYSNLRKILAFDQDTAEEKQAVMVALNSTVEAENCPEKTKKMRYAFATIAAYINSKGEDFSSKKYTSAFDEGVLCLFDMYLHDVIGVFEMEQCKSGCDRTLLLLAMKHAITKFESEYGYPFNPLDIKGELSTQSENFEQNKFAVLFREFAAKFGSPILNSVRGKPKVKWNGEVHWLFCDRTLPDPIPGLKL